MRNASFGGFGEPSNMDNQQAETFEEYSIENRGGSQGDVLFGTRSGHLGYRWVLQVEEFEGTDILNVLGGLRFACSTLQDPPSKKLRVGHPLRPCVNSWHGKLSTSDPHFMAFRE
jgi:hypothetical protein